jgi:hypothetical protein
MIGKVIFRWDESRVAIQGTFISERARDLSIVRETPRNSRETLPKLSWNSRETLVKLSWNSRETLAKLSWNFCETLVKQSRNSRETPADLRESLTGVSREI